MFDINVLQSFSKFLYEEDKIKFKKDYDVAILMTGKNLISTDYKYETNGNVTEVTTAVE